MKTQWGTRSERLGVTAEYAEYIRGMQLHTFRQLLPFGLTASACNSAILIGHLAVHSPSPAL